VHVCYCHNPFRYAWNERRLALDERADPITRAVLRSFFRRWREWDWIASQRVDRYVTNSDTTRARIRSYFGRDSRVVHPPVHTSRFRPAQPGDHYLVLSELVSHKRIDAAVRAFSRLGLPLVVAGDGPEREALARLGGRVRLLGNVDEERLAEAYVAADVFALLSLHEPWGIVVNEAAASGLPLVLSNRVGAAYDLLSDGENGYIVPAGDAEAAGAALRRLAEDAELRRRMGSRSRELVRGWGYEPSVENFVAAVRDASALVR
jgi:glycosyltransferase involved in cell wall biosynthesis